jgi:hypothetical protein
MDAAPAVMAVMPAATAVVLRDHQTQRVLFPLGRCLRLNQIAQQAETVYLVLVPRAMSIVSVHWVSHRLAPIWQTPALAGLPMVARGPAVGGAVGVAPDLLAAVGAGKVAACRKVEAVPPVVAALFPG